ncbi:ABC transporter ATP-binding protein [Streptomyces sp. MUM 178J]|uniref:ABC transporter ATP-binding protein n=1 Tax=Streptomyces sp. MUM 178J TaxID=2791991 RepID=UPI001F04104C|nr:ABC transporter ATP-binding protein [Streptomyces sp. MUM 178J]WRQ79968.1 ABC transporter ATP-binding protein [Streptomyces sp. MUM 178J]
MRRRKAARAHQAGPQEVSESERLLFGGPLRYEGGWNHHDGSFLELSLRAMLARMPRLIAATVRLAHRADARALRWVAGAELGGGLAQAVGLVAVNQALAGLLGGGATGERLAAAVPALCVVAAAAAMGALFKSASTAGTGRLEPKVFRVATEKYLERVARVELAAVEDEEFHKLLDSAQWGAESARRMIRFCTSVMTAAISLIAAAGVLTVLHPALLPLLAAMTLPSAWSSLTIARRRYVSFHTWVQHARAGQLLGRLLIDTQAAPEVRVHNIGPFLLRHFRTMAETGEREQTRLARLAARTGLIASGWTGLTAAATYLTLGLLLWSGSMDLAVAGTAVIAVRTGSASLEGLVIQLNLLYEESLFVADLDRLCQEADRRLIPEAGRPLPEKVRAIRFENVSFSYPGAAGDEPALSGVDVTIRTGRIVALVGNNGSGKSTLVKLLCGLYVPDSGRVLWDDVDAAEADRTALFDRVAVVAQDFFRWPFTARVNVAIGRPDAPSDEELLDAAARYAGADETVAALPLGWDTLLARGYKGGHQISGGQWQRLGIARARHRDAPVLVVDEPTSALDAEAEQRVFDQIRDLAAEGQTVVLITHRLHSVRHADDIYVLERGRVIEQGTFEELMRPHGPGVFRGMYLTQSRQYGHEGTAAVPAQKNGRGEVGGGA